MICFLVGIFLTYSFSVFLGIIIFTPAMIQVFGYFFFIFIPLAKLATIETFLEIGLLINFILIKLFGQRIRNRNFVSFIGILIILALVIPAMYYSFSNPFALLTNDIPVFDYLYKMVYNFFTNIVNHLKNFFLG